MKNDKLKFSVNPNFINKNYIDDRLWAFSKGFEPVEFTLTELTEVVGMGVAFSYQYAGGIRKADNFIATDILAVDIDGNKTISETLNDPMVKAYGSLLYTTPSHTPDHHRFRIVFKLARTITSATELRSATTSLARRLGGDMAATDAARIFYGSHGCHCQELDGLITDEFLAELIEDGKVIPVSDSVANSGQVVAARSARQLDSNFIFRTGKNQQVEMGNVTSPTVVYCPFHSDTKPSGFVALNAKRSTYFHCKSCQLTYWMKGSAAEKYDFNGFERMAVELHQNPPAKKQYEHLTGELSDIYKVDPKVFLMGSQFLRLNKIPDGLTFIKSPKGSGKTTFLSNALKEIIYTDEGRTFRAFEEAADFEFTPNIYTNKRVLLIGHRQALIRDLCKKLGLNCYLDDSLHSKSSIGKRQQRYSVCLDSIWKIDNEKYDVVIIDESEQLLSHFLSETIGNERINLFKTFASIIGQAKSVVALDADLDWVSFYTLTNLWDKEKKGKVSPTQVYINTFKPIERILNLYPSKNQLIEHIKSSVLAGKRVFIASNSKTKVKNLEKAIADLFPKEACPAMFSITSENSKAEETQHFINNIKTEILKYQIVLSSPSLGTGIDITFENGADEIDCVYGIFETRINCHTEVDQQLARVRNPKEVHVWVAAARFNFETEFNVIKDGVLKDSILSNLAEHDEAMIKALGLDVFIGMAALIKAHQRASINNLRGNLIAYKKAQNWKIVEVLPDELLVTDGKKFYAAGEALNTKEEMAALINAKPINQTQLKDITDRLDSNDENASPEEIRSMLRTSIEVFYHEPITEQLLEQDNKGRYRKTVRAFEEISDISRHRGRFSKRAERNNNLKLSKSNIRRMDELIFDQDTKYIMLFELLNTTPIFNDGIFDETKTICSEDLTKFAELSLKSKKVTDAQLQINTASDVAAKPIQHLGKILKEVGLSLAKPTNKQANGKKTYFYKLDKLSLDLMKAIVAKRAGEESGWNFVYRIHGLKDADFDVDDDTFAADYKALVGR